MRKLDVVKFRPQEDTPRQARGASASTERRYRYPAEEVWEVSEERWRVADRSYQSTEDKSGPRA